MADTINEDIRTMAFIFIYQIFAAVLALIIYCVRKHVINTVNRSSDIPTSAAEVSESEGEFLIELVCDCDVRVQTVKSRIRKYFMILSV